MDNYTTQRDDDGWFYVVITNATGASRVKTPFVSERAAQKWINRRHRDVTEHSSTIGPRQRGRPSLTVQAAS